MEEMHSLYPKLPKNIRQIGERDQVARLYLEDYVNTYLRGLYPQGGQDLRVGLLLGNTENHDGVPYIFVDGALEMPGVTENGEKVLFDESAWKKAYHDIEQMFPKRTIQGWFLCGVPGAVLSPLNYWKQHVQYFPGKNKLMYLNSGLESEEAIYITSEDGFYKLRGHSIYYERNQMMQDYMILRKDVRRVETGVQDRVIHDFRSRLDERKMELTGHRRTTELLGGLCSVLSIAVLAGGIVMFGNYQKMHEMESVLVSVLPKGIATWQEYKAQTGKSGQETEKNVVVEEVPGEVYPTTEDAAAAVVQESGGGQVEGTGQQSAGNTTVPDDNSVLGEQASSASTHVAAEQADGQSLDSSQVSGRGQSSGGVKTSDSGQPSGSTQQPDSGQPSGSTQQPNSGQPSGSTQPSTSTTQPAVPAAVPPGATLYTVTDGETLYGICLKFYHSVNRLPEICQLNGLENQDKIISGQQLILP